MASNGFLPHITLEHQHTHAQQSCVGVTALEALEEQFRRVNPGTPVPPVVYEQTCVHLEGWPWFLRLPDPPDPRSLWRHFKGPTIEVIDVARHTETKEPLVVYREHATGQLWVRPLLMFIEHVEPDVPRFFPLAGMIRR